MVLLVFVDSFKTWGLLTLIIESVKKKMHSWASRVFHWNGPDKVVTILTKTPGLLIPIWYATRGIIKGCWRLPQCIRK